MALSCSWKHSATYFQNMHIIFVLREASHSGIQNFATASSISWTAFNSHNAELKLSSSWFHWQWADYGPCSTSFIPPISSGTSIWVCYSKSWRVMPNLVGIELFYTINQNLISFFTCWVSLSLSHQDTLLSSSAYIAHIIKQLTSPIPKPILISVPVIEANCCTYTHSDFATSGSLSSNATSFSGGTDK